MKNNLYLFLSIWVPIIGALLLLIGEMGEWIFQQGKKAGIGLIEYGIKFEH